MTATIMSNAAISAVGEKQHLIFKRVRTQGPAMTEYDRLSHPPVLVVNARAVFGRDCRHVMFSFDGSPSHRARFRMYTLKSSSLPGSVLNPLPGGSSRKLGHPISVFQL